MVVILVFVIIAAFVGWLASRFDSPALGIVSNFVLIMGILIPIDISVAGYSEEVNTYSLYTISAEVDSTSESNTSKYLTPTGDSYTVKCMSKTGEYEFKEIPNKGNLNIVESENCINPTLTITKKKPVGGKLFCFAKATYSYDIVIPKS